MVTWVMLKAIIMYSIQMVVVKIANTGDCDRPAFPSLWQQQTGSSSLAADHLTEPCSCTSSTNKPDFLHVFLLICLVLVSFFCLFVFFPWSYYLFVHTELPSPYHTLCKTIV